MSTEGVNEKSRNIDAMTTLEMVSIINEEDDTVAENVKKALPDIALAIDAIADRLKRGGRLIYVGAGTSGRLAIQDAAECTVTYGVPKGTVSAVMAGGREAVFFPSENVEDNFEAGVNDIANQELNENDCVMGISASGNAAYVCGALDEAQRRGALTVSMICNEYGKIADCSEYVISVPTGAEVISGSTRMKAGTAQITATTANGVVGKITITVNCHFCFPLFFGNAKFFKVKSSIHNSICHNRYLLYNLSCVIQQ